MSTVYPDIQPTEEEWIEEFGVSSTYSYHKPYPFNDQTLVDGHYKKMQIVRMQEIEKEKQDQFKL